MKIYILLIFFSTLLLAFACQSDRSVEASACIERVLAVDDSLGGIRNDATNNIPMGHVVRVYVRDLERIDFTDCPEKFTANFNEHIEAWKQIVPILDKHDDLRGEMHDLFDQLEKNEDAALFRERLAAIWSTWDKVEKEK